MHMSLEEIIPISFSTIFPTPSLFSHLNFIFSLSLIFLCQFYTHWVYLVSFNAYDLASHRFFGIVTNTRRQIRFMACALKTIRKYLDIPTIICHYCTSYWLVIYVASRNAQIWARLVISIFFCIVSSKTSQEGWRLQNDISLISPCPMNQVHGVFSNMVLPSGSGG